MTNLPADFFSRSSLSMRLALLFAGLMGLSPQAEAGFATASALSQNRIVKTLLITKVSDLNFGDSPQGDSERTIEPGNSETWQNASFKVSGEADRDFFIILPSDQIEMQNLSNPTARPLIVRRFRSSPDQRGLLDHNGETMIYVGATRAAVQRNQPPGTYVGSFTVTVIY